MTGRGIALASLGGLLALSVVLGALLLFKDSGQAKKSTAEPRDVSAPATLKEPLIYGMIDHKTVYDNVRAGVGVIVDVRTVEEYEKEHIPGTLLIPIAPFEQFAKELEKAVPDKKTPLYMICRSGRRSHDTMLMAEQLGYEEVFNMGSIVDWRWKLEKGKYRGGTSATETLK